MIEQLRIIMLENIASENDTLLLSNYFDAKQVLRGNLRKILRIQIQLYPQTSFEPKYESFNLKNKVTAHGLGLVFQLR